MSVNSDWPITQVVVVTDPSKCPAGFTIIDKTYDKRDDADLWRDGIFGRRICRYMCVERTSPAPGRDVLVDVSVLNDKDQVPAGFTCIDFTIDTREKVMKKKMLCVRYMSSNLTNDAIAELIILSKGVRRPPNGYQLVGELNNMALCIKMAQFKSPTQQVQQTAAGYSPGHTAYATETPLAMADVGAALPYSVHPAGRKSNTLERAASVMGMGSTALSGIPWQINPKYADLSRLQDITIPSIPYKSIMDIEKEYEYLFTVERSSSSTLRFPSSRT